MAERCPIPLIWAMWYCKAEIGILSDMYYNVLNWDKSDDQAPGDGLTRKFVPTINSKFKCWDLRSDSAITLYFFSRSTYEDLWHWLQEYLLTGKKNKNVLTHHGLRTRAYRYASPQWGHKGWDWLMEVVFKLIIFIQ